MSKIKHNKPKIVDLFCGCGGLSFGLQNAGFDVVLGIDNWQDALNTFSNNHPHAKVYNADLASEPPAVICKKFNISPGEISLVVGGPPCQGFSISGKRNPNDPRNKLYKFFVNFIAYTKPKIFLMENVPNLVSMNKGAFRDEIINDFSKHGYAVSWKILDASEYGVPQKRRRVFFIGVLSKSGFSFPKGKGKQPVTVKAAISDLPENTLEDGVVYPRKVKTEFQKLMRKNSKGVFNHTATVHTEKTKRIIGMVPDGGNYKDLPKRLHDTRKVNIAWTRLNSKKPSYTIDTGHNHIFHYEYDRVPTTRESARIQSFPDHFIFLGGKTSQLKQVGNAVPPMLAEILGHEFLKHLEL